ncbi:hypothetical protein [Alteraurantiacibacter aquimixticola]|uniref:Uncharacterized protein n=1 Tax=Alteraurantiacibacter aquimixticola TaxID=2489173 RepID=A0A4T3F7Q3_9SPHN|nr:hypothetical protein [Alteraurantiacibacter aquimixticola]TIX51020.1 hypothetical protein E5222_00595 [Alteraurantiacibacter aquimixticola]
MNKALFAALAFGGALAATPAAAQETPVLGAWNTEAVTDFGTFAAVLTVAEAEDGYTVTMVDQAPAGGAGAAPPPPMESTISDVVVDGNSFSFKRSMTTPQGPMDLSYTGSVEGDALTAQVASDFGNIPVTGTRAEAEAEEAEEAE